MLVIWEKPQKMKQNETIQTEKRSVNKTDAATLLYFKCFSRRNYNERMLFTEKIDTTYYSDWNYYKRVKLAKWTFTSFIGQSWTQDNETKSWCYTLLLYEQVLCTLWCGETAFKDREYLHEAALWVIKNAGYYWVGKKQDMTHDLVLLKNWDFIQDTTNE